MESKRSWRLAVLAICAVSVAQASVDWSNPSGSTTYFDWSNGHNETGLFGSPIVISDNTFLFFPSLFRAEASNGATNTKTDTLTFDLQVKDNFCLSGIKVTEYGDYGVLGQNSSVSASGELKLESLVNSSSLTTAIIMNPTFPVYSGAAMWSGQAQLTGTFCNSVRISVSNELVAISSANTTTYIEKKYLGSAIEITFIPEPATLAILGLGMWFVGRKK
jgi:hypothetical protein